MIKKLFILILSVLIALMSAFNTLAFADENNESFVSDEVKDILSMLGIAEKPDDDVLFSEKVTRAEFLTYSAAIIGVSEKNVNGKRYYSDVPMDHWAVNTINTLTEMGIISGSEDKFYPDNYITLEQAVTIILKELGQKEYCEQRGGYPMGYILTAYENKIITNNINSGELTLKDVYYLLYNTLISKAYYISGVGYENNVTYETKDNDKVITKYFDIYKENGVVNSFNGVSIDGKSVSNGDNLRIDDVELTAKDMDVFSYLGEKVDYYYKDKDGVKTLLYISKSTKNDEIIIDIDDFVSFESTTNEITCFEKDKKVKKQISAGSTIIKNGGNVSNDIKGAFSNLTNGQIKLIETKNSGSYDVVIIENYENCVVEVINETEKTIYDKITTSKFFDLSNIDKIKIINSSNIEMKFSEIQPDNILSIAMSSKYCKIIVSTEIVTGTITKISEGSEEPEIYIDDALYKVDEKYYNDNFNLFRVGNEMKIYLDSNKKCVFAKFIKNGNYITGYLTAVSEDGGFSLCSMKIFNQNGEMAKLKCDSKVKINGTNKNNYNDIIEGLKNGGYKANDQLIRYKVNDSGKITDIITSTSDSNSDFYLEAPLESVTYYTNNNMMGQNIKLSNSTIIFMLPEVINSNTEDKDFSVMSLSGLAFERTYNVASYKTDKTTNTSDILVIKSSGSLDGTWFHQILLVDSINEEYDTATGESREVCNTYLNGAVQAYRVAEGYSMVSEGIHQGDIIRVDLNSKGEITATYRAYDSHNKTATGLGSGWKWEIYITYGYITSIKDGVAKFEINEAAGLRKGTTIVNSVPVMVYDSKRKNKIYKGDYSDILDAYNNKNLMFVGQKYGATTTIIIIK